MIGNVIFLYGPIAVGKLTVAKLLNKKLGYKLSHNHFINDLGWSIYEREELDGEKFIEELRYRFFEEVAKSHTDMVTTHTYAHDFVSRTGLSDPEYIKWLEETFEKNGTNIFFVHLKADKQKILDRVDQPSRNEYKKLTDKKIMAELLDSEDFETGAFAKNNITIDTTDLKPEETANKIIDLLKLN